MPDERTYRDDEIAEIFEAAAARRDAALPARSSTAGLTLAELQAIGSEVGLAPERIAEEAAALDLRNDAERRSDFGMPVSVRRTVDLPRAPTDREWEMLVADLRETFNARGRVGSRADVREWTNGNLHAYVEPTPTGYRLRMGTTKGNAGGVNRLGAAALVMALLTLIALFLAGEVGDGLIVSLTMAAVGGSMLGYNAVRLPAWAQEREEQMERVAARARMLLGAPARSEEAADAGVRDGADLQD